MLVQNVVMLGFFSAVTGSRGHALEARAVRRGYRLRLPVYRLRLPVYRLRLPVYRLRLPVILILPLS